MPGSSRALFSDFGGHFEPFAEPGVRRDRRHWILGEKSIPVTCPMSHVTLTLNIYIYIVEAIVEAFLHRLLLNGDNK